MKTWIGVVLLCCWISTTAWAEDKPAAPVNPAAQRIEASAVMASLKRLIEDPAWNFAPIASREELLAARSIPPETVRATELVRASLPSGINAVVIWVMDHTSEQAAQAHVKRVMSDDAQRFPAELGAKIFKETKGAGKDSKRPGHFVHRSVELNGDAMDVVSHVVQDGTLTIELTLFNVPYFDRATQDAHIEYALAHANLPSDKLTPPAVPKIDAKVRQVVIFVDDAYGEPVPNATVYLMHPTRGVLSQGECLDGHVALSAPLHAVPVVVVSPTSATNEPLNLAPAQAILDGEKTELRIRMAKGLSIEGKLVSAKGEPIVDAQLSATRVGASSTMDLVLNAENHTRTDVEGRFRIEGLASSNYWISAFGVDGYLDVNHREDGFEAGATDVMLRVAQKTTLRVQVVDPAGEALAGVAVHARKRKYASMFPLDAEQDPPITDAQGFASIEITDPNEPQVVMLKPADSQTQLSTTVTALNPTGPGQVFAMDRGWTLRLQATDTSGNPVASAVRFKDRRSWEQHLFSTAPDGTLVVRHLPQRSVEVYIYTPVRLRDGVGDVPWRTIDPTDELVTIPAIARQSILVSAVDDAGNAVPQGQITIHYESAGNSRSHGLAQDPLPLEVPCPNVRYRITISDTRDSADRRLNLAPTSVVITDPEQTRLVVKMGTGATLTGRVLNEDGTPVSNKAVFISSTTKFVPNERVETDAAGRFSITGLHASKLKVSASTKTHSAKSWVTTTAGKSSDVVLTLKKK